jgi:hypothetical protein
VFLICARHRFYFQVRQARRRYNKLLTEALVNQLTLRLIKCPDYPQPPKRGTPATVQFTRMKLIRPPCSSHRLAAGLSDILYFSFVQVRAGERPTTPRDDQFPVVRMVSRYVLRLTLASASTGFQLMRRYESVAISMRTLLSPPPGRS